MTWYRDRKEAGLFSADEETRKKAAAKLDKQQAATVKAAEAEQEADEEAK